MSFESAKEFVAKIQNDENFAKSFFALTDHEARKAFIKEKGFDFTKEEIDEAREGIDVAGGIGLSCCVHHEGPLVETCYKCEMPH
jgi:predicted ribosomally synthesized peptide with nif11-like leader